MISSLTSRSALFSSLLCCALLMSAACSKPSEEEEPEDMSTAPVDMSTDLAGAPDLPVVADMAPVPDMPVEPDMAQDMAEPDLGPDMQVEPDMEAMPDMAMMPDMSPPTGPARLRLATWNIYYLDTLGAGDRVPRDADDYAALQKYAGELAADVVALQEIHGEAAAQTVFPASEWQVECEDRNSSQNVCLALRSASGWSVTRHPDVEELRAGNPNLRAGLDVTLTRPGYQDLRLLAVHMKADCYAGTTSSGCTTYFQQIMALEGWIDARANAGEPFVVLGDFNRFMSEDDAAWLEIDDAEPAQADLTRSVASDAATPCWNNMFDSYIDHIMLDAITIGWLKGSEQIVFDETDFEANYQTLSDHCPLWADLDVPPAP